VFTEAGLMAMLVRGDTGRYLEGIALERLNAYSAFRERLGVVSAEILNAGSAFPALVNPGLGITLTAAAAALLVGFTALSVATALALPGTQVSGPGSVQPQQPQPYSPNNATDWLTNPRLLFGR
jgi:hypothetical protein